MPTYIKRKNSWRVLICCKGVRKSKTFPTKGECKGWAENEEYKIRHGKHKIETNHLLDDALEKYLRTVVPTHAGSRRETTFINAFRRSKLALKRIKEVTPDNIASWRDSRLQSVSSGTVNRELNVLSSVFTTSIREWGWTDSNPVKMIRRPKNPPPRNRRISQAEIDKIIAVLQTSEQGKTISIMFLLALQTAMRQAEICGIRREHVHGDYVHLPKTKNGTSRDVPLTPRAQELVAELLTRKPMAAANVSEGFSLTVRFTDIENLKFHDTRHEACVMLAKMLPNPMDLAKVTGHKDLKQLLNTYYNPTASELAAKLR